MGEPRVRRPDVDLFAEIAARPEPVGVLSIDTDGNVTSCHRMREFLSPRSGFTDELRVAFRSRGLTWGAIALSRGAEEPPFTEADARVAVSVYTQVAGLIQDVLSHPRDAAPNAPAGAAVIMIDAADRVSNMTPAAHARIEELGGWDNGSLPATVLVTAAAARNTPELATNRAVGEDGWAEHGESPQISGMVPTTPRPESCPMTTHLETQSISDLDPNRPHAMNQFWCAAFNAGDIAALMSTYEPDALMVPGPGAEPLQGHEAIAESLRFLLSLGATGSFTPRHWLVQDDIAFSSVAFSLDGGTDADGNPVEVHGVTTEVLRRQADGTWRYVIDHPFGGSD